MTVVQSAGDENYDRNYDKEKYQERAVVLGISLRSLDYENWGYSTFDLGDPNGEVLFDDPTIPSLTATAVAVHEWLHQFDYLGFLLRIEYPDIHAYIGGDEFPGYATYEFGAENYDYFEYYGQVLNGTVPYVDENDETVLVGMYPKMWELITRKFMTAYAGPILDYYDPDKADDYCPYDDYTEEIL